MFASVMLMSLVAVSIRVLAQTQLSSLERQTLQLVLDGLGCRISLFTKCTAECGGSVGCTEGRVTSLQLTSFAQSQNGIIPTQIGLLSKLTSIEFIQVGLRGTIPSTLGLLSNLRVLSLQRNSLVGTIPILPSSLTTCSLQEFAPFVENNCLDCMSATVGMCRCDHRSGCLMTTNTTTTTSTGVEVSFDSATEKTVTLEAHTTMPPIESGSEDMTLSLSTTTPTMSTRTILTMTTRTARSTTLPLTNASATTTTIASGAIPTARVTTESGSSAFALIESTAVPSETSDALPATGVQASPTVDAALIGGIVGGIAACLLLIGLIALIVMRRRNGKSAAPKQEDVRLTPTDPVIYSKMSFQVPGEDYGTGNIEV